MKPALWIVVLALAGTLSLAAAKGKPSSRARWGDLPESERVEVMREWNREREAAQQSFEALLMGAQPGANGSAVLDAAAGLARLAIAEGDYEALPRRLDRPLDPDQIAAVGAVVASAPARRLIATLRDYRDLEYAYRPLRWPGDVQRSAEIMQVVRVLAALAARQAEDGDFAQAYDTLILLVPIASWRITEPPTILNGILASAAVREGVRHVEELAQRTPPSSESIVDIGAALAHARQALDVGAMLRGETAYARWLLVSDLHEWREFADEYSNDEYWQILQEAADLMPWQRDASDWLERIQSTASGWLIPETRDAIDKFFETHFRIDLALEMLDYYADGTPPKFPLDPFTGDPPRWRETEDGCVVYSIGLNREDDGGVDRWTGKGYFDAVWRLPCDVIPPELGDPATP